MSLSLLNDPVATAVNGTDRTLWLSVYHKRIGGFRASIRREVAAPSAILDGLAAALDEADRIFSELLHALLQRLGEADEAASRSLSAEPVARRFIALGAAVEPPPFAAMRAACARCLVYLGDVARYRQMHLRPPPAPAPSSSPALELLGAHHTEWRLAARCYQRSLLISADQAGSAHNQLAVLSQTQGERAGAMMHYLCALSATKPFEVARDNLLALVEKSIGIGRAAGRQGGEQGSRVAG